MKTLKHLLIIVICVINASCNKNDDGSSSAPEQAYFPTVITSVYSTSSATVEMHIHYNSNNRISEFSFVNGTSVNTYAVTNDSNGFISSIINTRDNGTVVTYTFAYANTKVSQLTISNGTSSAPFTITYNEFNNTYSFPAGTSPLIYKYDASGNIIDLNAGFGSLIFNYNSNEGIFKNIPDSFPFALVMSIGSTTSILFDSLLFSSKQLTSMEVFGSSLNLQTTRNEQNKIETVQFINTSSSTIESTASIDYELRTINQ